MDVLAYFGTFAGLIFIGMAFFAWRGTLNLSTESIRLNHTGVLLSAGVFCSFSGVMAIYTQITGRLLPGGGIGLLMVIWFVLFILFVFMYVRTPEKFSSRMGWLNSHNKTGVESDAVATRKNDKKKDNQLEGNEIEENEIESVVNTGDTSDDTVGDVGDASDEEHVNDWEMVERFDEAHSGPNDDPLQKKLDEEN